MDNILILAIETATSCGSVSLSRGGIKDFQLLTECIAEPNITHSRRLMGSVEWAMQAGGVEWDDLDGIGVSIGPGSFTGLRIGLAAAKAIAMATGKPLLGVPTLTALSLACAGVSDGRLIGTLLDARKKEVYAGFYRMDEDTGPVQVGESVVVTPEKLLGDINESVVLAGPGVAVYNELFRDCKFVELYPDYLSNPRAAYVGILANEMLRKGDVLEPSSASPLYIRASEAELCLKEKKKVG